MPFIQSDCAAVRPARTAIRCKCESPVFMCGGSGHSTAVRSDSRFASLDAVLHHIGIYPGSHWENGNNERFNGTLRNEVLNAE